MNVVAPATAITVEKSNPTSDVAAKPDSETRPEECKPAGRFRRTDVDNARLLVKMSGQDLRYCRAQKAWYVWDGKRWTRDEKGEIYCRARRVPDFLWERAKHIDEEYERKCAFQWAGASADLRRIDSMITLAQSESGIPITAAELDADPWLLNTQNGVLDLRTGELHSPKRALLQTKMTATDYVPGARSELWDRLITEATNGNAELAAYIQRALGYALFGAWREKAFWFAYGKPDGGKSTVLGVVGDVLGDYHVSASASTWMKQFNGGGGANRGDVTRLRGARLVTTFEIKEGMRFDEELIKKVTGGDSLAYAAKYEHEIEFKPTFALWLAANDRPIIADTDEGMWARMRCVPFTVSVPEERQDKRLREKLTSPEHAPAVLAWLVEGCLAWQRAGGVGKCAPVEQASAAYRTAMNRAAAFFDDAIEVTRDIDHIVYPDTLRRHYDHWCRANGVRHPLQGRAWGNSVRQAGAMGNDDATRVGGKRVWRGIRIRPDFEDDTDESAPKDGWATGR